MSISLRERSPTLSRNYADKTVEATAFSGESSSVKRRQINIERGCASLDVRHVLKAPLDTSAKAVHYPVHMKAISYTAAREGLASTMDAVCQDRAPIVITRNRDQAVVMMSLDDYEELEETAHLLRSPRNAQRLLTAIQALESGKGQERTIAID